MFVRISRCAAVQQLMVFLNGPDFIIFGQCITIKPPFLIVENLGFQVSRELRVSLKNVILQVSGVYIWSGE